ncbi:choice-of-anchor L domain-containing protein [Microbacterium sp. SS28]|uniref:choice-of-anchor L domain-containing protein n=1 Tax=Microbacterium sp. SS28 TaxID=2919948 RepID=UPI001FA9BF4B|nr:choice-of-anchor L domain-containing protein [Microbacterium sp. SS28]
MILRRLAAALATAALVLGGAVAAAPAAAEIVDPAETSPFSISALDVGGDARPGEQFRWDLDIRLQDAEFAGPGWVAVRVTWPEGIDLVDASGCRGYIRPGEDVAWSELDDHVSGEECVLSADVVAQGWGSVTLYFESTLEPQASPLPEPAALALTIDRLVEIGTGEIPVVIGETVVPPASVAPVVTWGALYQGAVQAFDYSWAGDPDPASTSFVIDIPNIASSESPLQVSSTQTVWRLDWPDELTLARTGETLDDSGLCANASTAVDDGFCDLEIFQDASCEESHCPPIQDADGEIPGTPGPPPYSCFSGSSCYYLVYLQLVAPRTIPGDSLVVTTSVTPLTATYVPSEGSPDDMPEGWVQGDADDSTLVAHIFDTDLRLSEREGIVAGEEVAVEIDVRQIEGFDIIAENRGYGPYVAVELRLDWPPFLSLSATPDGCVEWRGADQICVLRFATSPPGETQTVRFRLTMPAELPDPNSGEIAVTASNIELWATSEGESLMETLPASALIGSAEEFSVFEPPIVTAVELSADNGIPGGDDVTATFRVSHRQSSAFRFADATAVVQVTWPEFLTPRSDPASPCEDFVPNGDGHGGVCRIGGLGLPGSAAEFVMEFALPTEAEAQGLAGYFAMEGVALEVENADGAARSLPGSWIEPSSARFVLDENVFPVDVILDRSVSTVGGLRLHVAVEVTYDHEVAEESDIDAVGLAITWPDFLELVDPPGMFGCEIVDDICFLTDPIVGATQVVELWFDMPDDAPGAGEISAVGVKLCDGPPTDCSELSSDWIGSDAEEFAVLEPEVTIDLTVDSETGWTGGQPITATATVGYESEIPGTLPGLTADLILDWPFFLTPRAIGGCDDIVAGGACRLTGLGPDAAERTITVAFDMPSVEPFDAEPSAYPVEGTIRVSGLALSYLALPEMPLPAEEEGDGEEEEEPVDISISTSSFTMIERISAPSVGLASTGQTVTDLSTLGPEELVDALVGPGIATSNVAYTGSEVGAGRFSGFDVLGFSEGVILSSGYADEAPGPNDSETTTGDLGALGDSDLEKLFGWDTRDASVLTFRFVPTSSEVFLDFVFASEEYSEYAALETHGVFAIFVNGVNCAITPDEDEEPVSVETINGGSLESAAQREQLYRDNAPVFNDSEPTSGPLDLEADGLTTVLQCAAEVTPNATNTMKIAIADTVAEESDSQVFIAAGSLRSNRPPVAADQSVTTAFDKAVGVTLSASDADGDELTYDVVAPPAHGVLSGTGPNLVYTPTTGFSGSDFFTFTSNDGVDESPGATVAIHVEPPEPVIVELPPDWIGADSVRVRVLQPKATIVPGVARPGDVVTVFLEDFPPGASLTMAWSTWPELTVAERILPADVTIGQQRLLIVRRAALGVRGLIVTSTDGRFGTLDPARELLVVPRSTVADELVGRGG